MFRAKVGGPEKQSSSSSPGLFPNPHGPGVWRGTEGGQLPSGVTLYLAASMCRSAAVLSPLSGKPRVLKWPASCPQEELAWHLQGKTRHFTKSTVRFTLRGTWPPESRDRGLDALG